MDTFLADCQRVVHIGANDGGERFLYESAGVAVLWVEPIPSVFEKLYNNIRGFRSQTAKRALLADSSGREVTFNIANNDGASSSMFELADHHRIWPDVHFVETISLITSTLDELLADCLNVDAVIIDTQGAELLILKGAKRVLGSARFVKAEAADFPAYRGGCTLDQLDNFLRDAGFKEMARNEFAHVEEVGRYFDVIWKRAQ